MLEFLLAWGRASARPVDDTQLSLIGHREFTLARAPEEAERVTHFHELSFDSSAFGSITEPFTWARYRRFRGADARHVENGR